MEGIPNLSYVTLGLVTVWAILSLRKPRRRYPPGPKGLPVLGNVFDIPLENGWLIFDKWARQYGSDIVHVEALGKHIYVINSAIVAREIFDGRPHNYSDKEQSTMLLELSGWGRSWVMFPYGDYWRQHRRLFHQHFRAQSIPQYHQKQAAAARRLLQLLLDTPADFAKHIRYATGSSIVDVVYSFDAPPGDPRLEIVEAAMGTASELLHSGIYLVDVFLILKYVPAWFPGAQFKRKAAQYNKLVKDMFTIPYTQVKTAMKEGSVQPCFTTALLSESDDLDTPERDKIFQSLVGTAYAAGTDTLMISMLTFMLAMVLHPEAQTAAQNEIDSVVGRDRLPGMADRESLPRVTALIQEVLRWHCPMPLATPHRAIVNDEYNGYHIAAGSVVLGNAWAMLHDEDVYPDPHSFKPDRFLTTDGRLRDDIPFPIEAFGFGRRICPGRYFAMDALFLFVSHVLAVFRIEHSVDAHGNVVGVEAEFQPQGFSPPKPFKAHFRLRYSGAEELVNGIV